MEETLLLQISNLFPNQLLLFKFLIPPLALVECPGPKNPAPCLHFTDYTALHCITLSPLSFKLKCSIPFQLCLILPGHLLGQSLKFYYRYLIFFFTLVSLYWTVFICHIPSTPSFKTNQNVKSSFSCGRTTYDFYFPFYLSTSLHIPKFLQSILQGKKII